MASEYAGCRHNFYDVLLVGQDATTEDIEKSYRRLLQVVPTDETPDNHFMLLQQAFFTLSDPTAREAYDRDCPCVRPEMGVSSHERALAEADARLAAILQGIEERGGGRHGPSPLKKFGQELRWAFRGFFSSEYRQLFRLRGVANKELMGLYRQLRTAEKVCAARHEMVRAWQEEEMASDDELDEKLRLN